MLIDRINLNQLRIFQSVYKSRSMTTAARELHLTQSGVSQHVKSLETILGVSLFDRIKQSIVPTSAAHVLYQESLRGLDFIENALSLVTGGENAVAGTVHLGTPIEFGNNILMPLLARFGQKYPHVKFELQYEYASRFNEALLSGAIDFAFIDEFRMDRRIATEKVFDEVLDLCISADELKRYGAVSNTKKFFESLDYVEYREGEPILRQWFNHHLRDSNLKFKVRAQIMDVQAVARLIVNGLGAGVLPVHVARTYEQEGYKIHHFKGKNVPLVNVMSVATLKERTLSKAASTALEYLRLQLAKVRGARPVTP